MSKAPPPLQGFNNNVRHRGHIFHIQTEDSGVKHPHVVTHLFADGGRIVKSKKTDYAEHVDRPDMAQVLRKLMKEQHKAMFIALRAGEFDQQIEDICGPAEPAADSDSKIKNAKPAADRPADAAKQPPAPPPAAPPASSTSSPSVRRQRAPSLHPGQQIDFDSIERAAAEAAAKAPDSDTSTAPPAEEPEAARPPPPPKGTPVLGTPAADVDASPPRRTRSGRYAAARPAAIFDAEPAKDGGSIFGNGVISEKSLDEVILSYLADDLEPPSEPGKQK